MKIIQINNYPYRRGGAESVFFNVIDLLRSKGHEVIAISRDIKGFNDEKKVDYLIPQENFFLSRFYSYNAKKILQSILEKYRPDIVHIHNIIGGISFSILPVIKNFNIPIVATIHDFRLICPVSIMINGKGEICEKCKRGRYYQSILNECHPEGLIRNSFVVLESYLRDFFINHENYYGAYLFVSHFTKEKYLEFYPELSNKSFVLYNFTQKFDSEIRRGNYFFYFGRYDREKGLLTLLKAFQQLKEFQLLLAGRGPYESYIESFNSSGNILNVGFKQGDSLNKLIKNSEFVIIPSECYENLPMSVIEALSLSKPIIVSGLGGLKEIVENSVAGFEFQAKNVVDLISVIKYAKSISDQEYSRLANNAYNFAINNFDQENFYSKLISIYQKAINSK